MSRFNTDLVSDFNQGPRIPEVIDRASCDKHRAITGKPCWQVWTLAGGKLPAICNARAKRAGFNAEINPASLGEGRSFGIS